MKSLPPPAATLPAALERAAKHFPRRGIAVLDGRGRSHQRRTYSELLASVRTAAGRWAAAGAAPGDRLMICLPTSWEWIEAWLGAMWLGALPVAVAPGGAMGAADHQIRKIEALIERFGARFLLTHELLARDAKRLGAELTAERAISPGQLGGLAAAAFQPAGPQADDLAFLQLTSGSTGSPRGVMISHRAAVHNPYASDLAIGQPHGRPMHQWAESMVSWLPLHHDMGLVGCLFLSLYAGLDLWLLPPATFLARPRLWLEQLGRHGKTFAPAPNFGYQLCIERLLGEARQGLDLSLWRDAMTGAEMIRPETTTAFSEAFADAGFRPETFRPCYGLAESTLTVTFDLEGRGVRTRPLPTGADRGMDLSEVVALGVPVEGTEIRITAAGGGSVSDGTVGEVRVRGTSIFSGYYNDPQATTEALVDGWLLTGDLGFVADGELYLTGRSKDLLILRGHNLMPHELEWLAEGVTGGGGAARCGAFSVASGAAGEQAVLVVETVERDAERRGELEHEIRSRVGRSLSLTLSDVVFVRRGKIPKTSSGKVRRRELRAMYLGDQLPRL